MDLIKNKELIIKTHIFTNKKTKVCFDNFLTGIKTENFMPVNIILEKSNLNYYNITLHIGNKIKELLRGQLETNTINLDTNLNFISNNNTYNVTIRGYIIFDSNNTLYINFNGTYNITLKTNGKIYMSICFQDKFEYELNK